MWDYFVCAAALNTSRSLNNRRNLMTVMLPNLPVLVLLVFQVSAVQAEEQFRWGRASLENIDYAPHKVLYDVSAADVEQFTHVLDRVSFLNNIYHADPFAASIVLVLHGNEIPFFAIDNVAEYRELMQRARSLTIAGPVEFRMCRVAASGFGLEPGDIQGFVKVVPMADAEIVRLQQEEGYAYMR
jgi:intracellular sulfur oxidation DsrE/DsrF family protein